MLYLDNDSWWREIEIYSIYTKTLCKTLKIYIYTIKSS